VLTANDLGTGDRRKLVELPFAAALARDLGRPWQ
jgi:hypothetical protein